MICLTGTALKGIVYNFTYLNRLVVLLCGARYCVLTYIHPSHICFRSKRYHVESSEDLGKFVPGVIRYEEKQILKKKNLHFLHSSNHRCLHFILLKLKRINVFSCQLIYGKPC